MASKCLHEALINRAESIVYYDEGNDKTTTVYKKQHTYIRIENDSYKNEITVGFHLGSEEWQLSKYFFPVNRDMSSMLRSVVLCLVDNMTVDDDTYTFDQFVAAKCILDWLLYV